MKYLLVSLLLFVMVFSVGCFAVPEPELDPEPVSVMEANVDAVLVEGEPNQVAWSIENIGDLFIREYIITFDVFYPMVEKDNVVFTVLGNYLEVGEKEEGMLDLISYDTPETVSVSWELFN